MIISSKVPSSFSGLTILHYLAKRYTYLTENEWIERIAENRVSCENSTAAINTIIYTDNVVSYDMPDFKEPPADFNYSIVFEDDSLLAINKTGNLLVHHTGRSFKSNLVYQLRYEHEPRYPQIDAINRLDRETSGVVLFAKDKETLRRMHRIIAEQHVQKEYVAIVSGVPQPGSGEIDLPIGKDTESKITYKYCVGGENAKNAFTRYQTDDSLNGSYTVVRLYPATGRTHQLRVHMKAIGCPILGDKLYAMKEKDFLVWRDNPPLYESELPFSRQALHCCSVEFTHPFTQQSCKIEAPLPADMKDFLKKYSNKYI